MCLITYHFFIYPAIYLICFDLIWSCLSYLSYLSIESINLPNLNLLRTTTACTFPTSQLPKVLRQWGVFSILTSKSASRHKGVKSFIIAPDGSAPEPQNIGKTQRFATYLFAHLHLLFLTLSLLWSSFFFSNRLWLFPPLLFVCPYCRKFDF